MRDTASCTLVVCAVQWGSRYMDRTVRTGTAIPDHLITRGLMACEMVDEIYTMNGAGEGSEILLTV
jgi:hypothetical protein